MEAAGAPAGNLMREVMAVEIEDEDGSATPALQHRQRLD
jgi:hypothetical protein